MLKFRTGVREGKISFFIFILILVRKKKIIIHSSKIDI